MKPFKRIMLITIDALRQDSLGCYGYKKNISPFLDGLAIKGTKLDNVFSTGPYSAASFPSILAGVYPLQFGEYIPLPNQTTLVTEILKKNEFKCAAFFSSVYMSRDYGYNKGFDFFQDYFAYKEVNRIKSSKKEKLINFLQKSPATFSLIEKAYSWIKLLYPSESMLKTSKSAETIVSDIINWIKNNLNSKFFIWVHFMDSHEPYFSTKKHYNKFCSHISKREAYYLDLKLRRAVHNKTNLTDDEVKKIRNMYDSAISYVDENVQHLFQFLRDKGLEDDTLLLITGDHGEEFNEHGNLCHKSKPYDINLKVPLILSKKLAVPSDRLISLIDLPPTILNLAGIDDTQKPANWKGINFLNQERDFVYLENYHTNTRWVLDEFAEDKTKYFFRGIRNKKYKYVEDDLGGDLLFDIELDPGESNNLINHDNFVSTKLSLKNELNKFSEHNNKFNELSIDEISGDKERTQERMRRLESLGYLD